MVINRSLEKTFPLSSYDLLVKTIMCEQNLCLYLVWKKLLRKKRVNLNPRASCLKGNCQSLVNH